MGALYGVRNDTTFEMKGIYRFLNATIDGIRGRPWEVIGIGACGTIEPCKAKESHKLNDNNAQSDAANHFSREQNIKCLM
jgi:hypothetical protein